MLRRHRRGRSGGIGTSLIRSSSARTRSPPSHEPSGLASSAEPAALCYHLRPAAGIPPRGLDAEHQATEEARPHRRTQRVENLRYRSTIKTLAKRLETAIADGDADKVAAEHLELVRMIDKAARAARSTRTPPPARSRRPRASSERRLAPPSSAAPLRRACRALTRCPATRPARGHVDSARCSSSSGASLLPPLRAWSRPARRTIALASSSASCSSAWRETFSPWNGSSWLARPPGRTPRRGAASAQPVEVRGERRGEQRAVSLAACGPLEDRLATVEQPSRRSRRPRRR